MLAPLPEMIRVLLVEDNPADIRLFQVHFKDAKLVNTLDIVRDGQEALDYLGRVGPYSEKELPHLILLDIHLPKKSGIEILEAIHANTEWKKIAVAVMTGSTNEAEILKSMNVNPSCCFVNKPVGVDTLVYIVQTVKNFRMALLRVGDPETSSC
jgi:two-component system, chemotaxis family, response regulator Rcp1